MKKFIGVGMLLALVVAPMTTAFGTGAHHVFTLVPGDAGPYSVAIGVTNHSGDDFTINGSDPISITTLVSGAAEVVTVQDNLLKTQTKFYGAGDIGCSGVCQVAVCAFAGDGAPLISTTALWTNNGEIIAVIPGVLAISPFNLIVPDPIADCPPATD